MKIAIMAAGGLGSYYGALLAKDGHDVTFIARGAHLQAIRANGLQVKSVHGDMHIQPAKATDNPGDVGVVDLVVFATKTYDTESAAKAMKPMIGANTIVATFQNGVESPHIIGEIVGKEHVVAAPTQIVSNIAAPGVIEQKSAFRSTTFGEVGGQGLTPRVEQLVDMLKKTGADASAAADGRKPMWQKLVFIASTAGLASVSRTNPYDLIQMPEARATLRAAMQEVYDVAVANGVPMDADIVDRQYTFTLNLKPGQKPSMQLDLEAGKRLEIDALSGAVVHQGAAKGVATPVHQTIYVALKMFDAQVKRQS